MTETERKWWDAFKRIIKNKPKTVELNARIGGEIGISPIGSRARNFQSNSDADGFADDEWEAVRCPDLDGRDSHI